MIVEQLSSLPDDTSALEPWTLTDREVRELTRELFRARAGLEELAVRLAAAADDRALAREDGFTSTTAWLAGVAGISKFEASKLVSLSRASIGHVERTRDVWAAGDLSTEQAGVIIRSVAALPDWIGREERGDAEKIMLDYAAHVTLDELRKIGNHLIEVIDPDGADEIIGKQLEAQERKAWDSTRLSLVDDGNGMTRIKGQIPTTQGAMLRTALEGRAAPRRRHLLDPETYGGHGDAALGHPDHAQRMGWAMCELIEHLPDDALPQAGGLPATLTVNVDIRTLQSKLGTACISTGEEISAGEARRLACNANLIPIVMGGESKVLDVSPARRLHDRYQRYAIVNRDGGCCWKGCDRPPAWCEVHHPEPFDDGGPTTVDNGALFCFIHHHLLHEGAWYARMADDGIIEVIPPARVDRHQRPLRHARFTKLEPRAA